MKKKILALLMFFCAISLFAQTKIKGTIQDEKGNPLSEVLIYFSDDSFETETNELGEFSLNAEETKDEIIVSAIGFKEEKISLLNKDLSSLKIILKPEEELKEIIIYTGKTSKKNNPAIDILRKIWANKKRNGLYRFNQYAYDKYEKLQFDLNSIDSTILKKLCLKIWSLFILM